MNEKLSSKFHLPFAKYFISADWFRYWNEHQVYRHVLKMIRKFPVNMRKVRNRRSTKDWHRQQPMRVLNFRPQFWIHYLDKHIRWNRLRYHNYQMLRLFVDIWITKGGFNIVWITLRNNNNNKNTLFLAFQCTCSWTLHL